MLFEPDAVRMRLTGHARPPRAPLIALLTGPTFAQSPASVETELSVKKPCRILKDDGQVGDYTLVRCPGLAGSQAFTEASPAHVSLSFHWGEVETGDVVSSYSLGEKLEWRGIKNKDGFKPYATIVRMIMRDIDSMDNDGRYKTYNVLAVMRMEPRDACAMAAVDEAENPDALALARAHADAEASKFVCRKDLIKIVGKDTRWAREALGSPSELAK